MGLVYKRFTVLIGFTVLLAVLLANTVVTRSQLAVQNSNQAWVDHTQQVVLELVTVESLLKDAEAGQRGFLYTEEKGYLDPYNAARSQLDANMSKLAELTTDPVQQARMAMLRRLTRQKQDEMAHTIELVQQGKQKEAKAVVLSNVGDLTMANIRSIVQEMRQAEDSLLAERLREVSRSAATLVRTIYAATALAIAGLVLLAFYILYEMNQRELYAAQIREREQWFRVTLGSIGDAVIATDENGKVIFLNKIAEDLTGIKLHAALGRPVQSIFRVSHEITRQPAENPVAQVLDQGKTMGLAGHTVLQSSDGRIIPIEDSAAPIYDDQRKLRGVVMIFRDVTTEKQTEEVMRKTEKLAAASRLAASMAHEINNPLEAVSNLIYLVKNSSGLTDEVQGLLSMAEHELERISHVTRQTLGFYRDPAGPIAVDVTAVVGSVMKLYGSKLKDKNIAVELEMNPCPSIQALQGDLKQLIANLVSNAADAAGAGGKIRISVSPAVSPEGKGVELKVADNGPGIAEENRARLFEPFFTTKRDIGTGLGLWVSKQIAERHRGSIKVANDEKGDLGGAVFTIFLLGVGEADAYSGAA